MYLETDASGVGLGARLLKVKEGMNCDEVQDNALPKPTAFANNSISSVAQW